LRSYEAKLTVTSLLNWRQWNRNSDSESDSVAVQTC
jgi:hypothetical protein